MFLPNRGVSDLARRARCSTTTVSKKLLAGKSAEQIIAEAEAWRMQETTRASTDSGNVETFNQAQRRKEVAIADLRELELKQKRGELVQISDVNAFVSGMVVRARDILLRVAPELRDRLAVCSDPIECERMVNDEVHRALRELSEFKTA
jgi:hypothetical protein